MAKEVKFTVKLDIDGKEHLALVPPAEDDLAIVVVIF